jgi:hypothetical protein
VVFAVRLTLVDLVFVVLCVKVFGEWVFGRMGRAVGAPVQRSRIDSKL